MICPVYRNVYDMYQMSHPPHLYVQLNNPRLPNHNDYILYRRMTGEPVHFFNESLFFNNPTAEHSRNIADENEFKNGSLPKKNGYWVSKRAIKTAHNNGNLQAPFECESDDSSVCSLTSVHNKSNEQGKLNIVNVSCSY